MKAAILTELNSNLIIDNVKLTDLKYGQVLTRNTISGLCGAQLQEISGFKGNSKFLPHLLGHEGCGIVEDVGVGVTKVKIGDKVVMHWRQGSGIDSPFPQYIYNNNLISSGKVTTLSEYSIVSENRLTVVEKNTPDELCALLGCSLTTALGTISNEANLKIGESVLIIGAGGVGLNLIQGAKLVNAHPIFVADVNSNKEKLTKECGATKYINTSIEKIEEILDKNSIDVIIDTTGIPSIIESTIPLLTSNGRYILIAQPKPNANFLIKSPIDLFLGDGKLIKTTQGGKTNPSLDIPRYIKLYNAGLLNYKNIITNNFKLDEINDAINLLRTGSQGRIMIRM